MQKDWGYAAFVEYGGKRILFDTGNNPDILAQNAKAKGIDLSNWISWLCRTAMGTTWGATS
jgi:7,8-dihydropterin-6-yl-methyl-4-(beta-D-ribofuranosyl)aminobenzene 5'-phosphate synthase